MDLINVLRTTGAVREFEPAPVPLDTLHRILDTARFAPSGGNRQGWRVVIVQDAEKRRRLKDLYLGGWYEYLAQASAGLVPWAPVTDEAAEREALQRAGEVQAQAASGPGGFAEHLDEAPALLVVLADLRALAAVDRGFDRYTMAGGASIYPFVWSILLAAREEGLAGVMTTMPIRREAAVKELFSVPRELIVAAVVALGRPVREFKRLRRAPVDEFATVDGLDGPPLRPA